MTELSNFINKKLKANTWLIDYKIFTPISWGGGTNDKKIRHAVRSSTLHFINEYYDDYMLRFNCTPLKIKSYKHYIVEYIETYTPDNIGTVFVSRGVGMTCITFKRHKKSDLMQLKLQMPDISLFQPTLKNIKNLEDDIIKNRSTQYLSKFGNFLEDKVLPFRPIIVY